MFIAYLFGFDGMYCFNQRRPLKAFNFSSIIVNSPCVYADLKLATSKSKPSPIGINL